jgi:hypothetical protein
MNRTPCRVIEAIGLSLSRQKAHASLLCRSVGSARMQIFVRSFSWTRAGALPAGDTQIQSPGRPRLVLDDGSCVAALGDLQRLTF